MSAASSRGRLVAIVLASLAVIGGGVTFAGWIAGVPALIGWDRTGIHMKANTALAAMAAGLSLLLLAIGSRASRNLSRGLALLPALIGGLTIAQHLTGIDLGIDTLIVVEPPGALATSAPGRMGPPASLSFLLLGSALLLATTERHRRLASGLGVAVLVIAALSITGYVYGAGQLYGMARLSGIALQTATMLAALAVGLLACLPEHGLAAALGRQDAGGVVVRRLLGPLVVLPLLLGALSLRGVRAGVYDAAFAIAVLALATIVALVALVWWTAAGISRHAGIARQAEEALGESERLLRRALDAGRMYAWNWDLRTGSIVGSANTTEVTGLPSAFTEAELFKAVHRDDVGPLRAAVERAAADGGDGRLQIEYRICRPGTDEVVWLHARGRVVRDGDGAVRIDGVAGDVTERKHAEEALRLADRRKDEFLATLAHELRNPLAPIRNALQIIALTDEAPTRDRARELAERQVGHMVRLIDDLMDVSRITRGQLRLQLQPVDLQVALASAVETVRPLIDQRGHHLTVVPPAEAVEVDADLTRLAQVFANLLANGAKYTDRGGHLKLSAEVRGDTVEVAVRDDGIGIEPEALPLVFDMFWQAGGAERGQEGMGIGLALVKGLVELQGGTVEARSEGRGRGSEFIVRLPVRRARGREETAPPVRALPMRAHGLRVLLVDDNRDNLESLGTLLAMLGGEVSTASDGLEAVERAAEVRPDVIFMDMGMPRLDGFEATRRIRAQPWGSGPRIYAMTGWGQDTDRQRSREAGCDGHLVKPVELSDIEELLSQLRAEGGHRLPERDASETDTPGAARGEPLTN